MQVLENRNLSSYQSLSVIKLFIMLDSKDLYRNKCHEIEQSKVTCSSWFILIWVTVSLSVWLAPCFSVWLINAVSLWWATPSYPEVQRHSVLVSVSAGTPETFYRGGVYKNSANSASVLTRTRCEFCPCFVVIISHNHYREMICMLVTCPCVHMKYKPDYQDLKRLKINCRWRKVKSAATKTSVFHFVVSNIKRGQTDQPANQQTNQQTNEPTNNTTYTNQLTNQPCFMFDIKSEEFTLGGERTDEHRDTWTN